MLILNPSRYKREGTAAQELYKEKYGKLPKIYDVVIGDGSRKIC